MLTRLLALSIVVSVVALVHARWEYRRRGRLSVVGLFLLCAMLFLPNLVLHYAVGYRPPDTPLGYAGAVIGSVGATLCLFGVFAFRSMSKVLCLEAGHLSTAGPYRFSRNPQYLGWLLFLLGFALIDWSLWCLAALLVVAISLHLLVLIEEEHLRRVFGDRYTEFCGITPRYAGIPKRRR